MFPSLTPVCLTSIATGAFPDVHHIPHLVWYHRGEERVIEYGSSFPAMRAVGARRAIQDTIFGMSGEHLAAGATTVFEALEDAGLEPAAINFTCYRGRTRHPIKLPALARRNRWYEAVYGPTHFFYFNLFESERTGAPLAIRSRIEGSIDEYAAAVGRWLVTRDAFDFLVFYLPDYDYASHLAGPEASLDALERTDGALARLLAAAGGPEEFLERYAVVVTSDHGQTPVERVARLQDAYPPALENVLALASNRAGMVYRLPGCRVGARELAERLDGSPAADVVLFLEDGAAVARRDGAELRFALEGEDWRLEGDAGVLDPDPLPERPRARLARGRRPDCGRRARLRGRGLGARRRGRPPSRRRRQPRLPRGRRLLRAARSPPASTSRRSRRIPPSPTWPRSPWPTSACRRRSPCGELVRRPEPDFAALRARMVAEQLERRGISDPRVLEAMGAVPREAFTDADDRKRAYEDIPVQIGWGQTISQPYMVALICEAAAVRPGHRVLDVGTGSGYQAAVLAELAGEVHTIERLRQLAERAREKLDAAGYERVQVHLGDGSLGDPEHAPFDAITVAAAAPELPQSLYDQLVPGGRLVIPVGDRRGQRLEVVVRSPEGPAVAHSVECRFVPLVGEEGY